MQDVKLIWSRVQREPLTTTPDESSGLFAVKTVVIAMGAVILD